jgi:hydroxymethylpyrimidine pyrophosphatase-like HAD family hydrolase
MYIAIDFDGTCVTHEYPNIGKDIGAVPVLQQLVKDGHKLILYTMRSGKELDDAVQWFNTNNIPLYGINENPSQKRWTTSPKIFAHIYIDDAAIGAPLITYNSNFAPHRPYICWDNMYEYINEKIQSIQK